jgi:L-ascorbate metabolism protein UlaG (beta-lactamase superfamily)
LKITWLGHSCFKIEDDSGKIIVTDPFDEAVGYPLPKAKADVVTVSHDHHDHNHVAVIGGKPAVVRGPGKKAAAGIEFLGIASYHDDQGGKRRGKNTIFSFEMDGIRVCHLGDLGHLLSDAPEYLVSAIAGLATALLANKRRDGRNALLAGWSMTAFLLLLGKMGKTIGEDDSEKEAQAPRLKSGF